MREIKFRAWDSSISKMISWSQLNRYGEGGRLYYDTLGILNGEDHHYSPMQYTGLKDKNGVEIYEGDILNQYNWVVTWVNDGWRVVGNSNVDPSLSDAIINRIRNRIRAGVPIEVIGNTYEHPELLEATQ